MAIETLGAALRKIDRLFADGSVTGLSDAQLLERFFAERDAAAIEVLVARHGPMVLGVCRGVLRDPNDAEDAFQATFLVLVKKGNSIRGRDALGGWLYQVAHRVALRANAATARRLAHERQAGQMAAATKMSTSAVQDELLRALHEEIARLPEKLRSVIVLCDLQGVPQDRAAGDLHWSERTLRRRLSEGRKRLKDRLGRRGLGADGAITGAILLREARSTVPAAWLETTVRAAQAFTEPMLAAGVVSAAAAKLSQEVLAIMFLQKLKLASIALLGGGLMAWGASAAMVTFGDHPSGATSTPVDAAPQTVPSPAPKPSDQPDPLDSVGLLPVRGQVLDPNGKPVAGAGVYVRHYAETQWLPIDPMAARQKGRVVATDADGRFHFELDKGASDVAYGDTGWHKAQIAVAAPGFAPAWVDAGDMVKRGEMVLRLVRDDVPVRGRVLDSQGWPVAGVSVRIRAIFEIKDGVELDAILASGALDKNWSQVARWYGDAFGPVPPTWQADPAPLWPGGRNAWTTGADGRFEVRGVGRDRIARLEFHGGGVADGMLDVMARAARTPLKTRPARESDMRKLGREDAFIGTYPQGTQLVGATFEFVAGPTKPFTGIVRLKGAGKPVEGAIVHVADPATHTPVTARTDAAGRFRLDDVPKGAFYEIRVNTRPGIDRFLSREVIVDDTEGLTPIEQTIELPPGVIVTARLIDKATGRVVQPAHVMYANAPENLSPGDAMGFSRRADGSFAMTVPPGRGMIVATAAVSSNDDPYARARLRAADRGKGIGDSGDRESVTIMLGGNHTYQFINVPADADSFAIDLELTRGGTRKGKLIDPTGKAVTGARTYGQASRWGNVRTLDADSFEVHGLDCGDPRQIVFAHKGLGLVGSVVLKGDDIKSEAPLVVRMERAGSVRGRLVDEDGLPVAGAMLSVTSFDLDGNNLPDRRSGILPDSGVWPDDTTFTTDADGHFQVEGLKPGVRNSIDVTATTRANHRLDTGGVFRNIVLTKLVKSATGVT